MAAPYWIDSSNQIWWMRYDGGIAETVGSIMIFLSLATLLLHALILIIVLFVGLSITETVLNVEMATPISCIRTFRLDRLAYIVEY